MSRKLVFISHITEESELAIIISDSIKKCYLNMLDTFVSSDSDSIPSGDRWVEKISLALESSVIQLVLCSHQSINRPWINFEAGAAWIRKIPVIPICHSGLSKDDLPIPLALLQSCDINKENDLKKAFGALTNALECDSPNIDYNDIITRSNNFSDNYMYYSKIKFAFDGLQRLYPGFVDAFKSGAKHIRLQIADYRKTETMSYIELLIDMGFLAVTWSGMAVDASGTVSDLEIDILPKLSNEDPAKIFP